VTAATSGLTTKNDLKRVQSFIARTPDLGVARAAFKSAVETITANVRWLEKNQVSLKSWLEQRPQISK
jgi:hypothetical protein